MTMPAKIESFISVVLIVQNPPNEFGTQLNTLSSYLSENFEDYEVLLISNKSSEDSIHNLSDLLSTIPHVRYIEMITHVPKDVAIASGVENAIGDFVVFFDIERDPIDLIRKSSELSLSGVDIVLGTSKLPKSLLYSISQTFFRKMLSRFLNYRIPQNFTGFILLSRRTVNTITRTGKFHHKLLMKISNSGYKIKDYPYNALEGTKRSSEYKKTFFDGLRLTSQLLVFNSITPLRFVNVLGLLGGLFSFLAATYTIIINFIKNDIVAGWTTQMLFSSALFFLLFVILSFFGEYLARLLNDISDNQEYDVLFEKNSSVMINEDRVNVLNESESSYENLVQTGRNK